MSEINDIETLVILLRGTNKKTAKYVAKRILEAEYTEDKSELINVRYMCMNLLKKLKSDSTTDNELKERLTMYVRKSQGKIARMGK